MKNPLMILVAASIATAGFVGWRVHAMRRETPNQYDGVYDRSLSFTGGCLAAVGSAERSLHDPGVSVGSTLSVFALGDVSTAYEPRRFATYAIPMDLKVIEGRQAGAERREQLLQDLWGRCRSLHPTLATPIYLSVQQALADLRAKGCKAGSRCGLWVATDLEENGDRAIEARLRGYRKPKDPLPRTLDNRGIKVAFCGYAQTAGRIFGSSGREIRKAAVRDPNKDDRLQTIWRSLFSRPELVTFEPYCPQPSIPLASKSEKRGSLSEETK